MFVVSAVGFGLSLVDFALGFGFRALGGPSAVPESASSLASKAAVGAGGLMAVDGLRADWDAFLPSLGGIRSVGGVFVSTAATTAPRDVAACGEGGRSSAIAGPDTGTAASEADSGVTASLGRFSELGGTRFAGLREV